MTTALRTATTTPDDLGDALDGLAAAAEQARDDAGTRAVLGVVVERLEDAVGAALGDSSRDPLVVLQRRFGRAHALLVARRTDDVDAGLLHGLARALRPEPAAAPRDVTRAATAAVLASC